MVSKDFYNRIKTWLEEEYQEIHEIEDERNPGPSIEFKLGGGGMAALFHDKRPHRVLLIRQINVDNHHRKALLERYDETFRKQLKYDINHEIASYGVPYNAKYSDSHVLQLVQFTKPVFSDGLDKNKFISYVFDVFNAGFRVIQYINKELN